ncbi:MAG: shikimate dehydrogenase [Actinomycetota bacterium]|nr:shikimate dehydrogenase [Actinomycetota bacterium]
MLRGQSHFAGILGWPLEHTLSPPIHNAAFRRIGLDWIYLAFPVPPENLGAAVAGLRALGCTGANVTMPHKEAVVGLLDQVSGDAASVGAVNTIQLVGDALIGHNTDIDGFRNFLTDDAGLDVAGRAAVILGAGGAARAVVRALDDLGAARLTVAVRAVERGEALAALAGAASLEVVEWKDAEAAVESADVVVNATPLGMRGERLLEGARWHEGQCAVDLVYHPHVTPFLRQAGAQGAQTWGGLGMLIHQAAASFRIWTGQDPPLEAMSAAAVRQLATHSEGP